MVTLACCAYVTLMIVRAAWGPKGAGWPADAITALFVAEFFVVFATLMTLMNRLHLKKSGLPPGTGLLASCVFYTVIGVVWGYQLFGLTLATLGYIGLLLGRVWVGLTAPDATLGAAALRIAVGTAAFVVTIIGGAVLSSLVKGAAVYFAILTLMEALFLAHALRAKPD